MAVGNTLPSCDDVLEYLCVPGIKSDINNLVARYKEISKESKRLFAAPAEERILTKLVWPLRYAKSCYMVGNYLGTIALCGMVAEMIAILAFEMSTILVNGKPLDEQAETNIFGSRFERLGQDRRVSILKAYNLIDDELKASFDIIRDKRRLYLHFYSQDYSHLAPNAVEVFNATVKIVVEIIGQDIRDGKIILKPAMLNYLKKKGIARPNEETRDESGNQNNHKK